MKRPKSSVLLSSVGDPSVLSELIRKSDVEVTLSANSESAVALQGQGEFDAVLLEISEDSALRARALDLIRERHFDAPLVAYGPAIPDLEREALASGAAHYLSWPASAAEVGRALEAAIAGTHGEASESPRVLQRSGLLGESAHMVAVKSTIARVGRGSTTVLVRGETGTGKELVARALHAHSSRSDAPFITVHAAALPDALLESELFGYEKGAFTGASTRKPGRVELAEGGTLFFDEIGEVSPAMQVKLLRLIQDREYERLGGTRTLQADVRFVAATHRDIESMVQSGAFREDLFYRLNVVTVWLPPLRARRGDVALVARHYFELFRVQNGKPTLELEDAALRLLQAQRWPGNVRQLVNFVERLVVLAQSAAVTAADVRSELDEQVTFLTQAATQNVDGPVLLLEPAEPALETAPGEVVAALHSLPVMSDVHQSSALRPLREEVRRAELHALTKALRHAQGNRAQAARLLGVSRRTLYTKLEEHGLG